MDPRIGVLMRQGRPVYYAHLNGAFPEGDSPEALLALLDGPSPAAPVAAQAACIATPRATQTSAARRMHDYLVTVTLRYPAWDSVPAELPIRACTAKEAVSLARQQMARDFDSGHTRQDGPLLYRARRAD